MSVLAEVIAALLDEFRWWMRFKEQSIARRVGWLTTAGLALTFLGGAIGVVALRILNRSAGSS